MKNIAHILSSVFSPLLVPTYGVAFALWAIFYGQVPTSVILQVTGITFLLTCILPLLAILALWKLRIISHPALNEQNDRAYPYLVTGLCYAGAALFLHSVNAPMWLVMLMVGGALAVVICLTANRWWKISGHMAAMGGVLGIVCRMAYSELSAINMFWPIVIAVVLTGAVASARLELNRHTLGQVLAGTAVGFLCVYLLS